MWLREDGCGDTVKVVWDDGSVFSSMSLVAQKIKECGVRLTEWSRQSFRSIRRQLEEKTRELIRAKWAAARGIDTSTVRAI